MIRFLKLSAIVFFVFCVLTFIWFFLTSEPAKNHPFFKNSRFEVIAHRGGSGLNPENTLEAFVYADKIGVDILEMDIRKSSDGVIILFHDKNLDRTTNCTGLIEKKSYDELLKCDAAYNFKPKPTTTKNNNQQSIYENFTISNTEFPLRNKGIQIPTLKSVFDQFPKKRMIIEIKQKNRELIEDFCQLITLHQKENQILVGAFSQETIDLFRDECPSVATSASFKESLTFYALSKVGLSYLLSPDYEALLLIPELKANIKGIPVHLVAVTPDSVKKAKELNLIVQVWTINDQKEMKRLMDMGVQGIMTDFPDVLLATTN